MHLAKHSHLKTYQLNTSNSNQKQKLHTSSTEKRRSLGEDITCISVANWDDKRHYGSAYHSFPGFILILVGVSVCVDGWF